MIVAVFKYWIGNELNNKTVFANSIEEAEDYVRTVMRNGTYKIQSLNIAHSYIISTPTSFKVKKRDDSGFPIMLEWRDKEGNSGLVKEWTELPSAIKKFKTSKKDI